MVNILSVDLQFTQLINFLIPHSQFFNFFFSFWSLKASSLPIWFVIIILLVIFEEKINRKFIIYFLISIALTGVVVFGLKNTVRRVRPTVTCDRDFSFPSGHAAVAFASAAVLATFDKKRKYFYYLVAILIALSRIYLGCHYFLDVFFGGTIGYLISRLILSWCLLLQNSSH